MDWKHFTRGGIVSTDTETTGLHWGNEPFCSSFCNPTGESRVFEFRVDPFTREVIIDPDVLDQFASVLEDPSIAKVGHNLKHDIRAYGQLGIKVRGDIHDTLFSAHLCNSSRINHKLKSLAEEYLSISADDEHDLLQCVKACRLFAKKLGWKIGGKKDVKADYWLPREVAAFFSREPQHPKAGEFAQRFPRLARLCSIYCVKDSERSMLLHLGFGGSLEEDEGLSRTYARERRLWPVVYEMESRGVRVSRPVVEEEILICREKMVPLRAELVSKFGDFNKQISAARINKYLFGSVDDGGLGFTPDPKYLTEKTRQPQTGAKAVAQFLDDAPALKTRIAYERYSKALNTYFLNYLRTPVLENGEWIIHASFNQIGPDTGRCSMREPSLHNVPKRAKEGDVMKRVRRPFGPRKGYIWLHCDYKAIEARVFAEEAGEEDMLKIFATGGDVYVELVRRVAAALYPAIAEWSLEEAVAKLDALFADQGGARQVCKNNFLGWTYGEGADKLAKTMGLPPVVALQVVAALKAAYPRAQIFMRKMQEIARRDRFIRNRYGRKVMIPQPKLIDGRLQEFYYIATNYIIQSTAADLLKEAMIRVHSFLQKTGRDAHLVMSVHDELVIEIKREHASRPFLEKIAAVMADNQGMFKRVATPTDSKVTLDQWSDPKDVSVLWEKEGVTA